MTIRLIKEAKEVQNLSVSGWSHRRKVILNQIDNNIRNAINNHVRRKSTEELLTLTRESESQVDDLINRLNIYKDILHTYNKSSHSTSDIDNLYNSLL